MTTIHTSLYSKFAATAISKAIESYKLRKPGRQSTAMHFWRDVTGEACIRIDAKRFSIRMLFNNMSEADIKCQVAALLNDYMLCHDFLEADVDRLNFIKAVLRNDRNYDVMFRKELQAEVFGSPRDPVAIELCTMFRQRLLDFDKETDRLIMEMTSDEDFSLRKPWCLKRAFDFEKDRRIRRADIEKELADFELAYS